MTTLTAPGTLADEIRDLLATRFGLDTSRLYGRMPIQDWQSDSLETVEAIFEVEKHFGVRLPEDLLHPLTTFDMLVAAVGEQIYLRRHPPLLGAALDAVWRRLPFSR